MQLDGEATNVTASTPVRPNVTNSGHSSINENVGSDVKAKHMGLENEYESLLILPIKADS